MRGCVVVVAPAGCLVPLVLVAGAILALGGVVLFGVLAVLIAVLAVCTVVGLVRVARA